MATKTLSVVRPSLAVSQPEAGSASANRAYDVAALISAARALVDSVLERIESAPARDAIEGSLLELRRTLNVAAARASDLASDLDGSDDDDGTGELQSDGPAAAERSVDRIQQLALAGRSLSSEAFRLNEETSERLAMEHAVDALLETIGTESSKALEIIEGLKRAEARNA